MALKDESPDYKRGYRDGIAHMKDLNDELACMDVLLGDKKLKDLSQRQLLKLGEKTVAKLKAQGK